MMFCFFFAEASAELTESEGNKSDELTQEQTHLLLRGGDCPRRVVPLSKKGSKFNFTVCCKKNRDALRVC